MSQPRTRVGGRVVTAAVAKQKTAKSQIPEGYPFKIGDVVTLTSGGFKMTVIGVVDTCAEKAALVEVAWAHEAYHREQCRDMIPHQCLRCDLDLDDNIPF